MPININYGADVGLLAKLAMSVGAGNGRQQSQSDVLRFMANRDNNATRARVAAMSAGGGRGRGRSGGGQSPELSATDKVFKHKAQQEQLDQVRLANEEMELTNEAQRVQNDKYLTAQEKQSGVNNLVQQGRGYQRKETPASLLAKNQTQFETTSWVDKKNPDIRWVMDKDGIARPNDISPKDGSGISGKAQIDLYDSVRDEYEKKLYAAEGDDFEGLIEFTQEDEHKITENFIARLKLINDANLQKSKMAGAAGQDPLNPAVPRPHVLNQVSDGQSGLLSGQGGIEFVQDAAQQAQAGNVADDIAFVKKALETPTGTSLESIFNSPVTNQGDSSKTNDPDNRSGEYNQEKKTQKEPEVETKLDADETEELKSFLKRGIFFTPKGEKPKTKDELLAEFEEMIIKRRRMEAQRKQQERELVNILDSGHGSPLQ